MVAVWSSFGQSLAKYDGISTLYPARGGAVADLLTILTGDQFGHRGLNLPADWPSI
jgi:hypothetical protein